MISPHTSDSAEWNNIHMMMMLHPTSYKPCISSFSLSQQSEDVTLQESDVIIMYLLFQYSESQKEKVENKSKDWEFFIKW